MVRPSRRGGVPVLRRQVAEAEGAERFAEEDGGGFAAAAGGVALFAAVDEAVEEGAGGDDGGAGEEAAAVAEFEAEDAPVRAGGTRKIRRVGGDGIPGPKSRPGAPDSRRTSGSADEMSSRTRSMTSAWRMWRPGWDSRTSRIFTR